MDLRERRGRAGRRHPWEVARARFVGDVLRRAELQRPGRLLDIGAGDGFVDEQLAEAVPGCSIVCWDPAYADLPAPLLASPQLCCTAQRPSGVFDGLLVLDVLEHVEDDAALLRSLVDEHVVAGGWLLLTVPAHRWLTGEHDRRMHHWRRYRRRDLEALVAAAGLQPIAGGGLFLSLLPVRAAQVLLQRASRLFPVARPRPSDSPDHPGGQRRAVAHGPAGRPAGTIGTAVGEWQRGRTVTGLLTGLLLADTRLSLAAGFGPGPALPGLSWWLLARR